MNTLQCKSAAVVMAISLTSLAGAAHAQMYDVTVLTGHTRASAINDLGQIVGTDEGYGHGPSYAPYLWQAGVTTQLGQTYDTCAGCTPMPGIISANDINSAGQITGAFVTSVTRPDSSLPMPIAIRRES